VNNDKFRDFPDWPLRHKLAHYAGTGCGTIVSAVLLAVIWAIALWQWLWRDL